MRLNFEYNEDNDSLTIEGVKYDGDLFRAFANAGIDYSSYFRFKKSISGIITLERVVLGPKGRKMLQSYLASAPSVLSKEGKNEREKS